MRRLGSIGFWGVLMLLISIVVPLGYALGGECCVTGYGPPPWSTPDCTTSMGCALLTEIKCKAGDTYFWIPGYCVPAEDECTPQNTCWTFNIYDCDTHDCLICEDCIWVPEAEEWLDLPGYECQWDLVRTEILCVPDCTGDVCQ